MDEHHDRPVGGDATEALGLGRARGIQPDTVLFIVSGELVFCAKDLRRGHVKTDATLTPNDAAGDVHRDEHEGVLLRRGIPVEAPELYPGRIKGIGQQGRTRSIDHSLNGYFGRLAPQEQA